MKLGLMGLGKMGSAISLKLLEDGHQIAVWNRSSEAVEELKAQIAKRKARVQNLKPSDSIGHLISQLVKPRVIWLMLPAGEATELVLQELTRYVEQGDIVIDGGNAFYKDTQKRYEEFKTKNIKYLGIGVSGGVHGFAKGYAMMVGGDLSAYKYVAPILNSLVKPDGRYDYFGDGGAGHFVKMVHNGIEYGMMQAIGEGFGILQKAPYNFDLQKVAKIWQRGTIISGFLIDCTKDALKKDPKLSNIVGEIEASGEGEWTVMQAKEEGVPIGNIEQALNFRKRSQHDSAVQNSFAAKLIAALRHEFGGHEVKKQ